MGHTVSSMQSSSPSNAPGAADRPRWTTRRLVLYLISISPVLLLIGLLAWGQIISGGNPGGLVEHNELGEVSIAARAAPAIQGTDLVTSEPVGTVENDGKIVMVDFWSSWCVACRVEAAALAEVYTEYQDRVEFVGVAIWDEGRDALDHIERFAVTYPNILDEDGSSAVGYGVSGVPEKFFLSDDGQIVRRIIGPLNADRLRQVLDDMLAG